MHPFPPARKLFTAAALLLAIAPGEARAQATRDGDDRAERSDLRDDGFWRRPRLAVGAGAGVGRYWRTDAAGDWGTGTAGQIRIGAQWTRALATDLRYFAVQNSAPGDADVLTHGGSLDLRLSLPLAVRPFASAGLGWYTTRLSAAGRDVTPPAAFQFPLGGGVEVPLFRQVSAELEVVHRMLMENAHEASTAKQQLWSGTLGARAYF